MHTQMPTSTVQLQHNKLGHLDTFSIQGRGFRAVVLKQGAQLIHFMTASCDNETDFTDNWLWVSEQAHYNQGESVRGGVPICWPVFGQFDANPQAVQDSFKDCPFSPVQHGYARTQNFELDNFELNSFESYAAQATIADKHRDTVQLILKLQHPDSDDTPLSANLDLRVKFEFGATGFTITLITQNNSDEAIHFSQALHTYLPTKDITQTTITGLDGIAYSDTLMPNTDTNANSTTDTANWQTKTQQGDIIFTGEVDRIYHAAPNISLNTPEYVYQLQAQGSNSTVIWNPWQDKAKAISQMDSDDYKRMLCIETANAHLDSIRLGAGEAHALSMTLQKTIP